MQTEILKNIVVEALEDLKGINIKVIDVRELTSMTDYLVIATGQSTRQVQSLAENVVKTAKSHHISHVNTEGEKEGEWVLVDLGDVVAHVMLPLTREYYCLEKLWINFSKAHGNESTLV